MRSKIMTIILGLSLSACANLENLAEDNEMVGGLVGAVVGGVIGSQFGGGAGQTIFTIGGTMGGALLGAEIGRQMTDGDATRYKKAAAQAYKAPVGQTVAWNNPNTGMSGTITPTRSGEEAKSGEFCREFQQSVNVDGQVEYAYGTACQGKDGSWRIIN